MVEKMRIYTHSRCMDEFSSAPLAVAVTRQAQLLFLSLFVVEPKSCLLVVNVWLVVCLVAVARCTIVR